ncbi:MAG: hypothetical protein WCA77_04965 [Thermoplasmata archaeon]
MHPVLREALDAMGYALPTAILALLAPRFAVEGFGVVIAAAAVAFVLRSVSRSLGPVLAIVPLSLGLLVACAIAPDSVIGVSLGGVGALATVVWLGDNRGAPRHLIDRWRALSLPGLAVAVAVVISLALPTTHAVLGIAAALVAGVVLLIAYLLDRSDPFGETRPEAS